MTNAIFLLTLLSIASSATLYFKYRKRITGELAGLFNIPPMFCAAVSTLLMAVREPMYEVPSLVLFAFVLLFSFFTAFRLARKILPEEALS